MVYLWKTSRLQISLCFLFFLLFFLIPPRLAAAANDPYVDNPGYLYLYTAYDGENYLDRSSVTVDEYRPPLYQLEGDFLYVPHDEDAAITRHHVTFKYNYTQQQDSYYENGLWTDVNALSRKIFDKHKRTLANLLFYAAYDIDFYH